VLLGLVGLFVARRRSAGDDGDEGVEVGEVTVVEVEVLVVGVA